MEKAWDVFCERGKIKCTIRKSNSNQKRSVFWPWFSIPNLTGSTLQDHCLLRPSGTVEPSCCVLGLVGQYLSSLTATDPFKPALCQFSITVPWPPWAGCWRGPPPPPGRFSWAVGTRRAPRADTPDDFLSAPAVSARSALQTATAETAGNCSPSSKCGASCTGTARWAGSRSLFQGGEGWRQTERY